MRLNHEFHRAINVAAHSAKLAQLMSQITRYAPESVFPTIEGWPDKSVADHKRILAALKAHDEDRARAAMSQHLSAGAAPLIEHLVKQGVAQRVSDDGIARRKRATAGEGAHQRLTVAAAPCDLDGEGKDGVGDLGRQCFGHPDRAGQIDAV